jgi:hypothetical protein
MNYIEELERVLRSEWIFSCFWIALLIIMAIVVWIANYRHFKKMFQRHKSPARIKKIKEDYKKSKWACVALTAFMIGLAALFFNLNLSTIKGIKKDIENNSFETYNGGYFVEYDLRPHRKSLYPREVSVYLDYGETVYIHNRNFLEYLKVESGEFNGKIVYGENSLIVVDIDSKE